MSLQEGALPYAEREAFYRRVIHSLVRDGRVLPTMSVLIVGGEELDRRVLAADGFESVTLSNVNPESGVVENMESLSYKTGSFDVGIVSAALHHCHSPHRALLELYRVCRVGVVALEARDSMAMRLAQRFGIVEEYELTAVADEAFRSGGVANSPVPNYVYKWTEREVEKTIRSAEPARVHDFVWFHELELPGSVLELTGKRAWRFATLPLRALVAVFPRQANLFGFAVFRRGLQPWMTSEVEPDRDEVRRRLGES